MKKENENYMHDNKIKKMIIKRINEDLRNKRLNKTIVAKEENNSNIRINISPNNTLNLIWKKNLRKELINLNTYSINEFNNNSYIKKTRNKKIFPNKKEIIFFPTSKSTANPKINFYHNNTFKIECINLKNINSFNANQSIDEEIGRKLFLNKSEKKNLNYDNKNKNKIYVKNFYKNNSKIKAKKRNFRINERNSSENNSYFSIINKNLSILKLSHHDKKNKFNNTITNSFTLNILNKDLRDNKITIINNSNNLNIYEKNKMLINSPSSSYIYKKKHFSSKSQENIHTNTDKYNILLNKTNKKSFNIYYYVKKLKEIIKIQKWWKEMIFHIYIEKKIIYIQKKYRTHLINRRNKNNNSLVYINNINKIILIQRKLKKFLLNKKLENKRIMLNYNKDDSYEKDIPKYIPFKLDNFDINFFTESYIDTKQDKDCSTIKNSERNNNSLIPSANQNIYFKKKMNSKSRLKKNNTVSHFNFSKYDVFNETKNNIKIQKNVINFYIKSINRKIDLEKIIEKELQKRINAFKTNYLKKIQSEYKCIGNISIEINNNKFNENFLHIPINAKCFIEKKYKSKKYKNIHAKENKFYYFSKSRINKCFITKKIILIQKSIKSFLNRRKNRYMKKEKLLNCFMTKIKKNNICMNLNINQIESFSFKGSNFFDNSNKDKINDKEIINLKNGKNYISNNVNLFSFDNNKNENENEINSLLKISFNYKEKINKLFNKYFIFIIISKLKYINKYLIIHKLIYIIKKNIIYSNKYVFNSLKVFILNKNENVLDHEEDNKINNINFIKNSNSLIPLLENKNNFLNFDDIEEISNYIYNYFYNEKKFTNISIKLIKERLKKSPLYNNTKNDLMQYIRNLYIDIKSNQICNICFCRYGEKFEDNCLCHKNNKKVQNKPGISIYRQKMNKIIQDQNKKRLNNQKINMNTIKNNDENENKENINEAYNFKLINYINKINLENQNKKDNNGQINRYDTESVHSKSRSKSK